MQQLDGPVDTSDQDTSDRNGCRAAEKRQLPRRSDLWQGSESDDTEEHLEDNEGDHLENDTSHHDVGANLGIRPFGKARRCLASAGSLNGKGDDVDGDEHNQIGSGSNRRFFDANQRNDSGKDDIDAGGDESGSYIAAGLSASESSDLVRPDPHMISDESWTSKTGTE